MDHHRPQGGCARGYAEPSTVCRRVKIPPARVQRRVDRDRGKMIAMGVRDMDSFLKDLADLYFSNAMTIVLVLNLTEAGD
jgi:hypothetical protein